MASSMSESGSWWEDAEPLLDAGLLSTVSAATPVHAAVSDAAWLRAMLDAESALARAQAAVGSVPWDAAATITDVAEAANLDLVELAGRAREAANPVVALVQMLTRAVAERDPAAAEYVHRGSTSQDVLDTAAVLVAGRALRLVLADLDRVTAALADLAARHRDTPMVGRTLTQHAVPVTFGLKAAGWLTSVHAARERLAQLHDTLPVQLGGAAGTLAGYLEQVRGDLPASVASTDAYATRLLAAYADELGLAEPVLPWHTTRAPFAELGAALAVLGGVLGKIAVDVQSLTRTEVAEVAEPAVAGRGASSAMPQKRNPVLATLVRSAALQLPALSGVLTGCLLHEDERSGGAWHAEWQPLRECLRLAGGAAHTTAELVEGLTVDPDRMRRNLDLTDGAVVTERLAAVLTPRLGRVAAKQVMTDLALARAEQGRPLAELIPEAPELAGVFTPGELADLLDPRRYLGASGVLVDRALARCRPRPA